MSSTAPAVSHTVLPPGRGASYWVVGDLITFKIGGDRTGGRYAFAETVVPPGGGPPPHVHRREDELFYVLDGDFAFVAGGAALAGSTGFAAYLPKGIPHTFKNVGSRPGRLLVAAAPSGFESFIPAAGAPCADPAGVCPPVTQADIDRLTAACPAYGLEMRFDHRATAPAPDRPADREWWVLGEHVRVKLTGADTAGRFSVAELTTRPGGAVPPHVHRATDEVFYVLDGAYDFHLGTRQTVTAWPGTFVHVPAGVPHGFRNAGPRPARLLDYHTPGGFERFFEEAGVPCADASSPPAAAADPDPARLAALFARHGMELSAP